MATLTLLLVAIIFAVLSLWLLAIPAEMLTGGFKALSHGGHGSDARRMR
jgi:hypothetical protein